MDSDGQPAITRRQGGCYAPRDPSRESIQGTLSEMSRDDHRRHTGRAVSRGTLNDTHRRNNVEIGSRPQFRYQQLGGTDGCFENRNEWKAGAPCLG